MYAKGRMSNVDILLFSYLEISLRKSRFTSNLHTLETRTQIDVSIRFEVLVEVIVKIYSNLIFHYHNYLD